MTILASDPSSRPNLAAMSKVKLLIRLGGLRMRHDANNNARRKVMNKNWHKMQSHFRAAAMSHALQSGAEMAKERFKEDVHMQQAIALARQTGQRSGKLALEIEEGKDSSARFWEQGDAEMYSQDNLDRRYGLRHDPKVAAMLRKWWATVQNLLKSRHKPTNRLPELEYKVCGGAVGASARAVLTRLPGMRRSSSKRCTS